MRPPLPRHQRSTVNAIGKIRDAGRTQQKDAGGVRYTPPGRLSRSEPVQKRNGLNKL
jgi:hypothetical protein